MAKRTVERDEVVTRTHTYEVCDKCGLEPEDSLVPLYASMENEVLRHNEPYSSRLLMEQHRNGAIVRGMEFVPPKDGVVIVERRPPEPKVEVCEACYDEMFGWAEDKD